MDRGSEQQDDSCNPSVLRECCRCVRHGTKCDPECAATLQHAGEPDVLCTPRRRYGVLGQQAPDGRETLLAVQGPGEMFGELSLFDPGIRTSTATALTDAVVLGLGREALRPWLAGRPEVAEALLQALAQRLRRTNEAMSDLVFSDVPGRVSKALLDLKDKFGVERNGEWFVEHDMTQEELAQLVGASRETVNKALADFVHRGWLRVEQRSVTITDLERLQRRAK